MLKRILGLVFCVMLGVSAKAFAGNYLVQATYATTCQLDGNHAVNPTADAVTALGTNGSACAVAAGWASGTNFTNGYKAVRLGKINSTCDSQVIIQSTTSLHPGTDKLSSWVCSNTPCIAADGNSYFHCTASP